MEEGIKMPEITPNVGVRGKEEDFNTYKLRRLFENLMIKKHLRGTCIWNSKVQGTYIKNK